MTKQLKLTWSTFEQCPELREIILYARMLGFESVYVLPTISPTELKELRDLADEYDIQIIRQDFNDNIKFIKVASSKDLRDYAKSLPAEPIKPYKMSSYHEGPNYKQGIRRLLRQKH